MVIVIELTLRPPDLTLKSFGVSHYNNNFWLKYIILHNVNESLTFTFVLFESIK